MKKILLFIFISLLITGSLILFSGEEGKNFKEDLENNPLPKKEVTESGQKIKALNLKKTNNIRNGCGDYRLLVTLETDAVTAGVKTTIPNNAIQLGWRLSGPGLKDTATAENVYSFFDEDTFLIGSNNKQQKTVARFLWSVTGVKQGQKIILEAGQEDPKTQGTRIRISNTTKGLSNPSPTLIDTTLDKETETFKLDLCRAEPLPKINKDKKLKPMVLAFYYQWWRPEEEGKCSEDKYSWRREKDGKLLLVSGHTPIFKDKDNIIYEETKCWQKVTDDLDRTGWIYNQNDIRFIAEQMLLAKTYDIDGFAVSVNGDEKRELKFLRDYALASAEKAKFKIAPLYEPPNGGWEDNLKKDIEKISKQLREILKIMSESSATLKVKKEGKDAVVIFVDGVVLQHFPNPNDWKKIRENLDKENIPYFLWSGPGEAAWVFESPFDGIYHDLDVEETQETPLGLKPYALRDRRRLAYKISAISAYEKGLPLALPVVTGWEASPALVTEEYVPLKRDYGAKGDWGKYYRVRWEDALEQQPDWIVITSWNEWAEGTEIEPSKEYPFSKYNFLQATQKYTNCWKSNECLF